MNNNAVSVLVVAFACALAGYGFHRKDVDLLGAMGLVSGAVTLVAGWRVHAKRKAKKKPAAKLPTVEKNDGAQ